MELYFSLISDIGSKRKSNQDSAAAMTADTIIGKVFFGVVCDGMGGYSEGEVASATVVTRLADWFRHRLPMVIFNMAGSDRMVNTIVRQWEMIVNQCSDEIMAYGAEKGIKLGTTCTCLLIAPMWYCLFHVGDTRIYYVSREAVTLVTEDHTVAGRELRENKITPEEVENHPGGHVLTQGVGMSKVLVPQLSYGSLEPDSVFVICSDGFRHKLDENRLFEYFNNANESPEIYMDCLSANIISENMRLGESDNMTVIAVKVE